MMLAALLGLAFVAAPGPSVEWSAPPACPEQAEVLAYAEALLGGPALDDALGAATIRGTIAVVPAGFVLEIEIHTPSGMTRKTARADDCRVLASVAALMVAVAVDPVQTTRTLGIELPASGSAPIAEVPELDPLTQPSEPEPRVEPWEDGAPASLPPPREPESQLRASLRGFARASGSIGRGLVPNLDGILALGVGVLAGRLRAEVVAFHALAQDARASSSAGATVAAWGGALRVGPRFTRGPLELHALGGVSVAALTATGFGVRNAVPSADTYVAMQLIPGLRWVPRPWVAVGADLEGQLALRRPAVTVGTLPLLYRTPPLGLYGTVVLELRWGGPG